MENSITVLLPSSSKFYETKKSRAFLDRAHLLPCFCIFLSFAEKSFFQNVTDRRPQAKYRTRAGLKGTVTVNNSTVKDVKVQLGNVQATKHVADIIRTCLGPRSMYKMLMDPQAIK